MSLENSTVENPSDDNDVIIDTEDIQNKRFPEDDPQLIYDAKQGGILE